MTGFAEGIPRLPVSESTMCTFNEVWDLHRGLVIACMISLNNDQVATYNHLKLITTKQNYESHKSRFQPHLAGSRTPFESNNQLGIPWACLLVGRLVAVAAIPSGNLRVHSLAWLLV